MTETWYMLEGGEFADPNECALDKDGVLRHKDGGVVAVKNRRGDYSTSSVDADALRAKKKAEAEPAKKKAAAKAEKQITSTEGDREAYMNRAMRSK